MVGLRKFYKLIILTFLIVFFAIKFSSQILAQHDPGITLIELRSRIWKRYFIEPDQGVEFNQVNYNFDSGRSLDTDWGEVIVDPMRLKESTGKNFGYINILTDTGWVVQNLRIQSNPSRDYPRNIRRRLRRRRSDTAATVVTDNAVVPATTYFDLGSDLSTDNASALSGDVSELEAKVIITGFPLPNIGTLEAFARLGPTSTFAVSDTTINAEGALGEDPSTPVAEGVGPPPPPGLPPANLGSIPFDPANFWYALPNPVNIHAANNQCIPMAHANSLQFLESTYGLTHNFSIPQPHSFGLGLVNPQPGDDLEGDGTLVGRLDTQMGREIESFAKGEGLGLTQSNEGYFSYLSVFTDIDHLEIRHSGGKSSYSAFGVTSNREENRPTFDWMCNKIKEGADIVMLYGRYKKGSFIKPNGDVVTEDRTSGHMVRVYECGKVWGIPIIRTLDDSAQNVGNKGLRYAYWWAIDTDDDGMLNLSGTNSEIEFAMSTLVLPSSPEIGLP